MTMNRRPIITIIIACAAVLSGSCTRADTPQIRMLSEQEAADLWNSAESREPIGEATVRSFPDEGGVVTVITSQMYMLRMADGGSGQTVTSCSGSCILTPGSTFEDCKTSGCLSTGTSCTPLVCSGGCRVSRSCQAAFNYGLVMR